MQVATRAAMRVFDRAGVTPVSLQLRSSFEPKAPTDVILIRTGKQITALVNQSWPSHFLTLNQDRIAAYAYWFSKTGNEVQQIVVDISDGNQPSLARYKFSSASTRHTLLPDLHFFRDYGYLQTDRFAADQAPAWNDRLDTIIWRGGLNGNGHFSTDPDKADNDGVIQRLRMAMKCKELDVDFRFIFNTAQSFCEVLRDEGLIGDYVPTHDWGNMKYAIDIDGYTNAWCNLMQRLKLGCCVLKVDSPLGYRQWYYEGLSPWVHYIPIKADLSDLSERIEWAKTNQTEARNIAQQGQAFAKTLTFDSETHFAVRAIEKREQFG